MYSNIQVKSDSVKSAKSNPDWILAAVSETKCVWYVKSRTIPVSIHEPGLYMFDSNVFVIATNSHERPLTRWRVSTRSLIGTLSNTPSVATRMTSPLHTGKVVVLADSGLSHSTSVWPVGGSES